jgi:hypothetical protein
MRKNHRTMRDRRRPISRARAALPSTSSTTRGRPEEAIRAIPLAKCLPPGDPPSAFEEVFHQRNLLAVVERRLFERN